MQIKRTTSAPLKPTWSYQNLIPGSDQITWALANTFPRKCAVLSKTRKNWFIWIRIIIPTPVVYDRLVEKHHLKYEHRKYSQFVANANIFGIWYVLINVFNSMFIENMNQTQSNITKTSHFLFSQLVIGEWTLHYLNNSGEVVKRDKHLIFIKKSFPDAK